MDGVFISYRRNDCAGHAGRLYDRLVDRLGEGNVFMDIDAIEPGVDFGVRIDEAIGTCRLLIVLIGDDWLEITGEQGQRRLDDPADFVRLEIASGLRREELRVIPVLVEGASMPLADRLPDDIKPLARRNALELSDARWRYDVERLIEVIERAPSGAGQSARGGAATQMLRVLRARPWRTLAAGAAIAGLAAVLAIRPEDKDDELGGAPRATRPVATTASSGSLLDDERKKRFALNLVSPFGDSAHERPEAYGLFNAGAGEGCGVAAGIIGFCSETGDIRRVLLAYKPAPGSRLAFYVDPLEAAERKHTTQGLDGLEEAWKAEAADPAFQRAQDRVRERTLELAVRAALDDGLGPLGQLAYYGSMVHLAGPEPVRRRALDGGLTPPGDGGDERAWLGAVLAMLRKDAQAQIPKDDDDADPTARNVFVRMRGLLAQDDLGLTKRSR